jgi:glycosyltransferase involved in cell wall biosynthesis
VIENGKNGYVCKTEQDFANKIQYLIDHHNLRLSFGEAAHRAVLEKYNSSIMAKQYEKLFLPKY